MLSTTSLSALLLVAGASQVAAGGFTIRKRASDDSTTTPTRLLSDPVWTYKGCYDNTAVGQQTVRNLVSAGTGKWTIEGCLAAVEAAEYSVGGIIYGGEWGSDTIPDTTQIQDSSKCEWKCNDDHSEYCGGQASLDVYFVRETTKLIDDETWSYQGCYSDDNGSRTLANLVTAQGPQAWTIEKCLTAVNALGYTYGAVEYGGECWGANSLRGDASKLSTSKCNMRCNDAADNTCGGTNAVDVYKLRHVPTSTTHSVTATSTSTTEEATTTADATTTTDATTAVDATTTVDATTADTTTTVTEPTDAPSTTVEATTTTTSEEPQATANTCSTDQIYAQCGDVEGNWDGETCCPTGYSCLLSEAFINGYDSYNYYCVDDY